MSIAKKLEVWQAQNLISAEQAKKITAYEKENHKSVLTLPMLALGFFCIGLGIVSLISANWQVIPDSVKLAMDLIIMLSLAESIFFCYFKEKDNWFEGLLLLFSVMVMASIGLIAQIYQLQTQGLQACLLWCVLVFPLVIISRKVILPLIWLPIFTASAVDTLSNIYFFRELLKIIENTFPFAISVCGILIFAYIYRFISYYFRTRLAPQIKAMKFWLGFDIVSMVILMDFGASNMFSGIFYEDILNGDNYRSILVICCLILANVGFGYFSYKYNYSRLLTCVLAILLGFSIIYMTLPDNSTILDLWGFLLTMSILSTVVAYALIKNRVKLLNVATACMAIRIFFVYLQVFGSMFTTGIGLIISGILFLSLIYGWKKLHLNTLLIIKESK